MIFWIFDCLLLVAALVVDYKLHWIVCQLIPLAEDHALEQEPSVLAATVNLLSGMSHGVANFSRTSSNDRTCTTFVALFDHQNGNRPSSRLDFPATPIHRGGLRKKGRINTAFQDRYFVLRANGQLCYYESERAFSKGSQAKGFISVLNSRMEKRKGSEITGFRWAIIDAHDRVLEVSSFSKSDRKQWMDVIETRSTMHSKPADPVCQGVMRKRGRMNTAYQSRFFVLFCDGQLNCYESENKFQLGLAPAGSINILGARVDVATSLTSKMLKRDSQNDVEWSVVEATSERCLELSCDDEDQVKGWKDAILQVSQGTMYNHTGPLGLTRTDENMTSLREIDWNVHEAEKEQQDDLPLPVGTMGDEGKRNTKSKSQTHQRASIGDNPRSESAHNDSSQEISIRMAALKDASGVCSRVADDIVHLEAKIAQLEAANETLPDVHMSMLPVSAGPGSVASDLAVVGALRRLAIHDEVQGLREGQQMAFDGSEETNAKKTEGRGQHVRSEGESTASLGGMEDKNEDPASSNRDAFVVRQSGMNCEDIVGSETLSENEAEGDGRESGTIRSPTFSSRGDSATTPRSRYSLVSPGDPGSGVSSWWPNDAEMTSASFAAAWSDVELALEYMNRTPSGLSAPSSWDGSVIASGREVVRGSREASRGQVVNVQGQHFGRHARNESEDIRLEIVEEEAVAENGSPLSKGELLQNQKDTFDEICEEQPQSEHKTSTNVSKMSHQHIIKRRQAMLGRASTSLADLGMAKSTKVSGQDKQQSGAFGTFKSFRGRNKVAAMIERVAVGHDEDDDDMQINFQASDAARQGMRAFVPPYVKRLWIDTRSPWRKDLGGHCINNHHKLFWLEKNGPKLLLRMIRYLLLGCVVMITIALEVYRAQLICEDATDVSKSCTTSATGVFLIILALVPPGLTVILLTKIINNYVLATSVELLRSQGKTRVKERRYEFVLTVSACLCIESILQVVQDAKAKRSARLFNTLLLISSIIEQV